MKPTKGSNDMSRYLKTFGLTLIAVSALAAFSAASASAKTDVFTASVDITVGHEVSDVIEKDKLIYGAGSAVCARTTGIATTAAESSEIALQSISYDECTFGAFPATIHMEGCDYLITGETVENAAKERHGRVHIVCPEAKHITITVPALDCNLTITNLGATSGSMTPENGITYTNGESEGVKDITAKITMKGIHVIKDPVLTEGKESFACSLLAKEGNATYTGTQTLTGFEDERTHDAAHRVSIDFKEV
jgi:hypothetical protein